jgi:hypothetical protein
MQTLFRKLIVLLTIVKPKKLKPRTQKKMDPRTCVMYKNAANKLKWGGTLASYEVLDFQHDPMHNNEPFEQLSEWINEHKPYIRALVKAAHLRQQHYETYIRGKLVEDPKHAHWRIGMNEIAADASAKLDKTTQRLIRKPD